jgi:hypothetical protein
MAYQAGRKVLAIPKADATRIFSPLVFSAGGLPETATFAKLKDWQSWGISLVSYKWMLSSVSVALAKARGRTFLAA